MMPATGFAGASRNSEIIQECRFSRGRWRAIDFENERAEYARLRACESILETLTWYRARYDERQTKRNNSPKPQRPPTRTQKLRAGLVSGKFCPPNAGDLLADVDAALAGNRVAQEKIVAYLNLPGVLEALHDG